jgi:HD-GYP domain-containing protein (c-di-GMP phosphodiesterase class II)
MRRVSIEQLSPGCVIGSSIRVPSPHPDVIYQLKLEPGTELTEEHINRLSRLSISKVPIKDSRTEDLDQYVYDESVEEAEEEVAHEFEKLTSKFTQDDIDSKDLTRLRSSVRSLIESLKNSQLMAAFTTLKTHDSYTAQHSLDVAKISLQLALEYEIEFREQLDRESGASASYICENMLEDLGIGAMLHDIGKRDVSQSTLNKSSKLNDEEWEEMKAHTKNGHEALKKIDHSINAPVKVPAYQHHEKFDGTGYPNSLEGKEIHLFGRICAPSDVYSALTSSRPYREAKPPAKALEIMASMQEDGPHFDPDIYDKFRTLVFPYPIGEEVSLSDGSKGVVCDVDESNPGQPTVRILEHEGERLEQPEEITVSNRPGQLQIVSPAVKSKQLLTA